MLNLAYQMEKLDQDCNAEHKQKGKAGTVVKKNWEDYVVALSC